ncbi:hypothetical protein C1H46_000769 [Malus baccata]|uniref:Pentacotripeptide-repeat region of PRORP domain-containing protein n=1 Tax=Malus baccata TaxID=106549 RepID=A0A540NRV2_MALBA|nr:hypothetical protein C1H46_000769 [Malus baccata]
MKCPTNFNCFSNPKRLLQPPKTQNPQNPPSIVEKLRKCSTPTELESLCASMIKTNAIQDSFFTNQLITAFSTFSRLDYAVLAFTQMENPNVFVYNAMIRGFVHCDHPFQALNCYINMLRDMVLPSSYTFSPLIKACTSLSALRVGESVHCHIWRNGFGSHVFVQTALIDFYSKLRRMSESRRVFDEMPDRDAFAWTTMVSSHSRVGDMSSARILFDEMTERNAATWNTMIDGYARVGDVESAELLFNQMPTRDIISWTTMIDCYSQNKKFREALAVFDDMRTNGISSDEVTLATVISACAHLGALDLGKEIHLYAMENRFDLDVYIGSALIDMYAKCGTLERSLLVFFKLRDKNLFCWNAAIEGLAVHGYAKEALAMFSKMEREEIKPNGVTFVSVLSACTHAGLVQEGHRRFSSMIQDYSIRPEVEHYGCMVDLLSKAGLLENALGLIRSMEFEPNSVIWGALLGGCKLHKNLEIAQVCVEELMVLEPNSSGYFNLLVNMCADAKRWGEVADIRATMKELGVEKGCPGSSWIEMERKVHQFAASDESHSASAEIYSLLAELYVQLKLDVYVPELGSESQGSWFALNNP